MGGRVPAALKNGEAQARQSAYHFGPSVPKARKTRTRRPHLDRPTIPIAYLELLIEILAERDFTTSDLFAGLPFEASLLAETRMSAVQWTRLVLRAQELTQDAGLGYEYGLRMRPTAHGLIGYAAMTAGTMREAIAIVLRYAGARQSHFDLALEERGNARQLVLRERFPIPVSRTFFYENILLGLARGSAVLLGKELHDFPDCEICFDTSEPSYYDAWRTRLPGLRFDEPVNAVRFPAKYLDYRPALADPHASRQAIALCERELSHALDRAGTSRASVLAEFEYDSEGGGYPALDEVAARLHLSTRTLKRRLLEEGTSFMTLLNEKRTRDARDLLSRTSLSVQEIAGRLGYENPANFSRAFAKSAGQTPTEYRAAVKQRS
jgi:AraC-like DNA-binding protein